MAHVVTSTQIQFAVLSSSPTVRSGSSESGVVDVVDMSVGKD